MKKILSACLLACCLFQPVTAKTKKITLRVIETTDVHGSFFPYDFITRKPLSGTLARVSNYVKNVRKQLGDNVILLENGDILQGQPTCYYYNYINTNTTNVASDLVNYMKYDAQGIGNHDVETGHACYDKWIKELNCPVLAANMIDNKTGNPYVKPYVILEKEGAKIAILGLITPAIPNWLTENIWSGIHFEDMETSAKKWIKIIQDKEKPDVIIGLFHSGAKGGIITPEYKEDASLDVAINVPGFDLIMFGHDHTRSNQFVTNIEEKKVLCIDPANNAKSIADAELVLTMDQKKINGKKQWIRKDLSIKNVLTDITKEPLDQDFMEHFSKQIEEVKGYVNRKIGEITSTISTRDGFFGSSAFTDLILNLELQITKADIAFNAPVNFDSHIQQGPIYVGDMFNLYKFENQLYVMRLTGEEIRKHLEMSYDLWVNTMKSPEDHLLLLSESTKGDQQRLGFKNFSFNFDSAAGIDYEVDVTKPNGQKVHILKMSNGQPFDEKKWYNVAINSYRGNGGGELLTKGAGIPRDSLKNRIVWRSERDQRYYLMEEIEKIKVLYPKANNNWKFVPEKWVKPAAKRDYDILFGERKE